MLRTEARGWRDMRKECKYPLDARKSKDMDFPLELPE